HHSDGRQLLVGNRNLRLGNIYSVHDVLTHAHNGHWRKFEILVINVKDYFLPDRIAAVEIFFNHGIIDDPNHLRTCLVAGRECASRKQRNTHRTEVVGADRIDMDLIIASGRKMTGYAEPTCKIHLKTGSRQAGSDSGGFYSWQLLQTIQSALIGGCRER